jgi:hypothetical protein
MVFRETSLPRLAALLKAELPLALMSACRPGFSDEENLDGTKRLAFGGRDLGFGFAAIEGHWVESMEREWWVLMIAERERAAHLLGHARRWAVRFGQEFSIFRRWDGLGRFGAYDSRKGLRTKGLEVGPQGMVLSDGSKFEFERAYVEAGFLGEKRTRYAVTEG